MQYYVLQLLSMKSVKQCLFPLIQIYVDISNYIFLQIIPIIVHDLSPKFKLILHYNSLAAFQYI